jgi:hypothetical protein
MARLSQLIGAGLLALFGASAHAGYAQLATPERFGGAYPNFTFAPSANDAKFGNIAFQPNGLKVPVPGTPTTMPAAYRFAANAPRVAAGVIFMHPALRTAAGIAAWLGVAKIVWDEVEKKWKREADSDGQGGVSTSDGFEYSYDNAAWFSSGSQACQAYAAVPGRFADDVRFSGASFYFDQYKTPFCAITTVRIQDYNGMKAGETYTNHFAIYRRQGACPTGWYQTPAGCVQTPPPQELGRDQFEDALLNPDKQPGWPRVPADWPMPESVPWELPFPTPLPVQPPMINPAPSTNPNPLHNPKFVPTGDPVANPNYDPNAAPSPQNQPYIQPGIRVQPSPTPTEPWRVDLQPVNRPTPTTNPDPDPDPDTNPGDNDNPKPEEQQSLCEKHPDILACQKLDQPEAKELAKEDINISITPVSGWGAENAACPAPRSVMVAGRAVSLSWQPVCDFATGLRPLVIALAWLSAVSMVIVVARRN